MNIPNREKWFRIGFVVLVFAAALPLFSSAAFAQRGPPRRASRPPSLGQLNVGQLQQDIVGVAIWYAEGQIKFDGASSSSSNEVKGYTDVLPTRVNGKGFAIGLSFASWGLNFGFDKGRG